MLLAITIFSYSLALILAELAKETAYDDDAQKSYGLLFAGAICSIVGYVFGIMWSYNYISGLDSPTIINWLVVSGIIVIGSASWKYITVTCLNDVEETLKL